MIMNNLTEQEKDAIRDNRRTPPSVKEAPYSKWWFTPAWRQMHYSNAGNNLGVVVGGNGTGKSWMLGWVAETLGVNKRGEKTLFDTDHLWNHVCFDAKTFSDIVSALMKLPKYKTVGYQILLDEGQLALYSKEAFNEEVKNLSRLLMTVRSRRWGVYINLPSFKMLNKDVRTITNWMVWMKGKPTDCSHGTYYEVNTNLMDGEPNIKKPVCYKTIRVMDRLPFSVKAAHNILEFPKPSKKFIVPYEKMKAIHQRELYNQFNISMHKEDVSKEEKKSEELDELVQKVISRKNELWTKRYGLPARKISAMLGIGYDRAMKIKYIAEAEIKGVPT